MKPEEKNISSSQPSGSSGRPGNKLFPKGTFLAPLAGILAELLFVLLPLVVIVIIRLYQGLSIGNIIQIPEISFAAAIIFGQIIAKLVSAAAICDYKLNWQVLSLIVSCLIVFGLVPSLTILAIILISQIPPTSIYLIQFLLFLASIMALLSFGCIGQLALTDENIHKR